MRYTRDQMFLEMAETAAKRSTCFRANVGAIIVIGDNPVSMGYNGPPSGADHCHGHACAHREDGGCARALHAERNAIERYIKRHGTIGLASATMYCTFSPCRDCAELIGMHGIGRLVYRHAYRDRVPTDQLAFRMVVHRLTPSGYLVNHQTGELVEHP